MCAYANLLIFIGYLIYTKSISLFSFSIFHLHLDSQESLELVSM